MKLFINQADLDAPAANFMRDAGYVYITSYHTGHGSFVRNLGGGHYPRFHVYVEELDDKIVINLHLDQKQASYEGTSAHAGEYDGPLVEGEISRLRNLVRPGSGGSGISRQSTDSSRSTSGSSADGQLGDERARRWSDMLRGA